MNQSHTLARHLQADSRLQEVRQLAYEYVKQIVLKAHELSQQQSRIVQAAPRQQQQQQQPRENHINNHERQTGCRSPDSAAATSVVSDSFSGFPLIDPINKRLVDEAAVQINRRFRLPANPSTSNNDDGDNESALTGSRRQISTAPNKHQLNSNFTPPLSSGTTDQTSWQLANKVTNSHCVATKTTTITTTRAKCSTTATTTTTVAGLQQSAMRDYIEQDYATISSSQDDNEPRGVTTANESQSHNQRKGGRWLRGGGGNGNGIGNRGGFLHQCLNWHLLVSCFSTCLPGALTRHTSKATGAQASGGSGGPAAL